MKKPAKAAPAGHAPAHAHDHKHCVEDALAAAERLCAAKDLRFTPLRRRVLELVWSSHKPVGAYALLDKLRNELLGSDGARVSLADLAMRWGFAHQGRFSAEYRQRFGEAPSATLRRLHGC